MDRVNPVADGHRQQQRHQHHDGGKNLHQCTRKQQEHRERQQEDRLVGDHGLHPFDGRVRDAGINQVIGERQRHTQDQQHTPNDLRRLAETTLQQLERQLPVRQGLGRDGIGRGQGGALGGRGQAADQRAHRHNRRQQFPLGSPGSGPRGGCRGPSHHDWCGDGCCNKCCTWNDALEIAADQHQKNNHHHRRHQACQKHGVDRHTRNDGVHDQRY